MVVGVLQRRDQPGGPASRPRIRGIPIFNAPYSNTRSVAELVIGEIVMLLRRITSRSEARPRTAAGTNRPKQSFEVRGKTLGIVGYGSIGSQLSTLAEAMGMRVIYYDVIDKLRHGNTEPVGSRCMELLGRVRRRQPARAGDCPPPQNMMGAARDRRHEAPAPCLINNSPRQHRGRFGGAGRLPPLAAISNGAAIDVFPVEPAGKRRSGSSTPLQGLTNVILTPHIGGSTERGAGADRHAEVAHKLIDYSDAGSTMGAVNFPQVQLPPRPGATRYIHVHHNVPGMLGRINAVFSSRRINIAGQYLQTDGELGYVVVEITDAESCEECLGELRALEGHDPGAADPVGLTPRHCEAAWPWQSRPHTRFSSHGPGLPRRQAAPRNDDIFGSA